MDMKKYIESVKRSSSFKKTLRRIGVSTKEYIESVERGEMVYFAVGRVTGLIKVGHSRNTERRLKGLRSSSEGVGLLATMPGGKELESALHRCFKRSWCRGEWYNPTQELMRFISGISGTPAGGLDSQPPQESSRSGESDESQNAGSPELGALHEEEEKGVKLAPEVLEVLKDHDDRLARLEKEKRAGSPHQEGEIERSLTLLERLQAMVTHAQSTAQPPSRSAAEILSEAREIRELIREIAKPVKRKRSKPKRRRAGILSWLEPSRVEK